MLPNSGPLIGGGNNEDLIGQGIYGNKADGNVTYTSGTTTLTAAVYADTITLQSGAVVDTAGFPVRCHKLVFADATCYIGEQPAQAAITSGCVRASTAGSAGGTAGGTAGSSTGTFRIGGNSGAGGDGSSGTGGAGATGVLTIPHATSHGLNDLFIAHTGWVMTSAGTLQLPYGAGCGGGGGGDGVTAGGQGGSSGRHVNIAAKIIQGAGTIRANGGTGANAGGTNCGGGGGGGGGWLVVIYRYLDSATTLEAAGGAGGTGTGTGTAGTAGSAGVVTQIVA